MRSSVTRRLSRQSAFWVAIASVAVAAALGAGSARAQVAEAAAPGAVSEAPEIAVQRQPYPFAGRFPNLVVKTHEGRNVRFYDDLLKDKIVLINFMYATCTER